MFANSHIKPRLGNPQVSELTNLMSCIKSNAELTALSKATKFEIRQGHQKLEHKNVYYTFLTILPFSHIYFPN